MLQGQERDHLLRHLMELQPEFPKLEKKQSIYSIMGFFGHVFLSFLFSLTMSKLETDPSVATLPVWLRSIGLWWETMCNSTIGCPAGSGIWAGMGRREPGTGGAGGLGQSNRRCRRSWNECTLTEPHRSRPKSSDGDKEAVMSAHLP